MSKELEALNKLFVLSSEYHQKLWCLRLAPVYPEAREKYIDRIVECLPNDAEELNDLYNCIKQALKRNEPMKPKVAWKSEEDESVVGYRCLNCNGSLGAKLDDKPMFPNFCRHCGQKLVWSDEND